MELECVPAQPYLLRIFIWCSKVIPYYTAPFISSVEFNSNLFAALYKLINTEQNDDNRNVKYQKQDNQSQGNTKSKNICQYQKDCPKYIKVVMSLSQVLNQDHSSTCFAENCFHIFLLKFFEKPYTHRFFFSCHQIFRCDSISRNTLHTGHSVTP